MLGPLSVSHSTASAARTKLLSELKLLCARIIVHHGGINIEPGVYKHAKLQHFGNIAKVLRDGRDNGKKMTEAAFQYTLGTDSHGHFKRWFGAGSVELVREKLKRLLQAYNNRSILIRADTAGTSELRGIYGSAAPRWMEEPELYSHDDHVVVNLGKHFFTSTAKHSAQLTHDQDLYDAVLARHMALKRRQKEENAEYFRQIKAVGFDDPLYDSKIAKIQEDYDVITSETSSLIKLNASQVPTSDDDKISVAGVILHEVTHNVLNTTDVEKDGTTMYGPNLCAWLAARYPSDATKNADSFRLFCEEFLT